ncbi:hypothetical protein [Chitinibacter sp. ZOR0017]|uniref:Acg family FMN-binding oxidoreductase n=1 Tax=Chitinibacter sp. ZOR0017 TaxID=1339254 RepID=UPI000648541F|nr:hypothetical protein [Chitinibacter sp. ZOR0017]
MNRRQWLRLCASGMLVATTLPLTGCSTALPAEAIAAWQPPSANLPLREWVLAHAILAPNAHNLQSWLVNLDTPDTIWLRLDPQRLLPATDPYHRQLVMSQGTFLELLAIAAQERGYRAEITPFPAGEFGQEVGDTPIARVRLLADASVRPDPLFAQILQRHTNRSLYLAQTPTAAALAAIRASVAGLPVEVGMVVAGEPSIAEHRRIAQQAWEIELSTPAPLLESYRVLRVGPAEIAAHRDGISLNTPLIRLLTATGLFDRSRPSPPESAAVRGQVDEFNAKIASTQAFFWLITLDNRRGTQLAAGRAYVRAQLAATAQGLVMHPLQQALQEYPEQSGPYAAIRQLLGMREAAHTVQMWARLGYAPPVEPAPRRGLAAHLRAT